MGERVEPRPLRVWSTMEFAGTPEEVADAAVKQGRLWKAVGRGEDRSFRVVFGATHSDADMAVIGTEGELLPVLTELADRFGEAGRFHVDARTEDHARWLDGFYGEGSAGGRVFTGVEHDPDGDWNLPGREPAAGEEHERLAEARRAPGRPPARGDEAGEAGGDVKGV